jgi:hypothetical protein
MPRVWSCSRFYLAYHIGGNCERCRRMPELMSMRPAVRRIGGMALVTVVFSRVTLWLRRVVAALPLLARVWCKTSLTAPISATKPPSNT